MIESGHEWAETIAHLLLIMAWLAILVGVVTEIVLRIMGCIEPEDPKEPKND